MPLEAASLSKEKAFLLSVNPAYPAFHIQRLTYTFKDAVTWVEYLTRGEIAFEDIFYPQRTKQSAESLAYYSES